MDTLHTTLYGTIKNSLEPLQWFLMLLGCFMYWLKTLNTKAQAMKGVSRKAILSAWAEDNFIEVPTSVLSCVVLAVIGADIPTEMIDLHGKLAVFIAGYSSSSILNGVITTGKQRFSRPVPPEEQPENYHPDSQGDQL